MKKNDVMELRCPAVVIEETDNGVIVELVGQNVMTEIIVNKECLHKIEKPEIDENNDGAERDDIADVAKTIKFFKDNKEFIEKDIIKNRIERSVLYNILKEDRAFGSLCDKIKELHARKNHDYGNAFHDMFSKYGIVYPFMHIEEKFRRLESITRNGNMVDEGSVDSLIDMACYALMTINEIEGNEEQQEERYRL